MAYQQGFFTITRTCPACQGAGQIIRERCLECRGAGRLEREKTIELRIPPGVDSGTRLRVTGEGEAGPNGGPAGDLYVVLDVKEHQFFERRGADLYCTIPLSVALAIPALVAAPNIDPAVERGFRQMYDLNFDQAHKTFTQWERDHPADPIGPASNAAAYLYAEFDRLKILQSELFVEDGLFRRRPKPVSDPAVRLAFDGELSKADQLAGDILSRSPEQADALFAKVLVLGLRSDGCGNLIDYIGGRLFLLAQEWVEERGIAHIVAEFIVLEEDVHGFPECVIEDLDQLLMNERML